MCLCVSSYSYAKTLRCQTSKAGSFGTPYGGISATPIHSSKYCKKDKNAPRGCRCVPEFSECLLCAQILADALKNNDPKTAFDVLWEIEAFPTYVQAAEEEAQREAAAAEDKGSSKKSSKDKGDKKKGSKVRMTQGFSLCVVLSSSLGLYFRVLPPVFFPFIHAHQSDISTS